MKKEEYRGLNDKKYFEDQFVTFLSVRFLGDLPLIFLSHSWTLRVFLEHSWRVWHTWSFGEKRQRNIRKIVRGHQDQQL